MIARLSILGFAVAIALTGVAFLGVALFYWLSTALAPAGAAAVTALIFFVVAVIVFALFYVARPLPVAVPQTAIASKQVEDSLVPALTLLAKEHPLIAVGCATALGLADALQKQRAR